MQVTVYANRTRDDRIMEVFTWNPRIRFCVDPARVVYHKIMAAISAMAIHHQGFKLLDIQYNRDAIIYIYEFSEQCPMHMSESQIIEYYPVLGEKTCTKCLNKKIYKGIQYCALKGNTLRRNSHFRCHWWQEAEVTGENRNVYKQGRSARHDETHGRIRTHYEQRANNIPALGCING